MQSGLGQEERETLQVRCGSLSSWTLTCTIYSPICFYSMNRLTQMFPVYIAFISFYSASPAYICTKSMHARKQAGTCYFQLQCSEAVKNVATGRILSFSKEGKKKKKIIFSFPVLALSQLTECNNHPGSWQRRVFKTGTSLQLLQPETFELFFLLELCFLNPTPL